MKCISAIYPSAYTIPAPPPNTISGARTKQNAPMVADASGRDVNVASAYTRRRTGRGSLRIPLASSGLTRSGLNLPSG